jgi:hypothetical protein
LNLDSLYSLGYPTEKELEELDLKDSELLQYGLEYRQNTIADRFKKHGANCIELLESILKWNPKVNH